MFEGFKESYIQTSSARIFVRTGGATDKPPLLLLHGYPQTSAMWHAVATLLQSDFHIICPDLRGYGKSDKPESDSQHATYSKRAMANDMVDVMAEFGHETFYVGAHDRGARVAHRLGMDHPDKALAMSLLDIAPTREMYANTTASFATAYWHWFFLIQDQPLPEQMIGHDPKAYWNVRCEVASAGGHPFSPEALEEYYEAFCNPQAIHATCEDYRAAATIDIEHDNDDGNSRLTVPLQVLWGSRGIIEKCFDALALWRQRADNVQGQALDTGHYVAEERPEEVAALWKLFFQNTLNSGVESDG